jgi:hypothetical protein
MELSALLHELASSLGMESLELNENGVLSLQFDDTIVINLEPDPQSGECHLYSSFCRAPEDAESRSRLFGALLAGNCFGRGTDGAAFSLDESSDEILLGRQFDLEAARPEQLLAWLRDLVTIMDIWQQRLPEITGDTARPAAQPPDESTYFIRA